MFCNFIKIDGNNYECSKCGNKITVADSIDHPPIFPCFPPIRHYSPKNITNFMGYHKDSSTLCDENEIDRRHNICLSCPAFADNSCSECGCNLTKHRNYLNKLALKDANCPLSKW